MYVRAYQTAYVCIFVYMHVCMVCMACMYVGMVCICVMLCIYVCTYYMHVCNVMYVIIRNQQQLGSSLNRTVFKWFGVQFGSDHDSASLTGSS